MTRTDWYEGWQHPVRIGVYERLLAPDVFRYLWDGLQWTHVRANSHGVPSYMQDLPWRGLTEESK